jgi:hypothetical protein
MEFDWDSFNYSVNNNDVVPILGNDLSVVRLTKSSIAQSKSYEAILQTGKDDGEHIIINLYNVMGNSWKGSANQLPGKFQ